MKILLHKVSFFALVPHLISTSMWTLTNKFPKIVERKLAYCHFSIRPEELKEREHPSSSVESEIAKAAVRDNWISWKYQLKRCEKVLLSKRKCLHTHISEQSVKPHRQLYSKRSITQPGFALRMTTMCKQGEPRTLRNSSPKTHQRQKHAPLSRDL